MAMSMIQRDMLVFIISPLRGVHAPKFIQIGPELLVTPSWVDTGLSVDGYWIPTRTFQACSFVHRFFGVDTNSPAVLKWPATEIGPRLDAS
jgi:hypothetical protein